MNKKKLRLSAEYHCNPVWGDVDDGDFEYQELRDVLHLDTELILDLMQWQNMWDATFVDDDPNSSGFKTKEEAFEFDKIGLDLLWRLRQNLPNYQIWYNSMFFKQEVIQGDK